ncbi:hypothetical protein ACFO26_04765 [Lactococcus nasutitermitis]|uniref:Uncharacterized protein n=1 Tax=Lactococcus nasutitermitis TaxID=1652957 RepID=A0ABV9JBP4_9LACT|nr:hypothetical protein [Lactococcus nasutitermitis]
MTTQELITILKEQPQNATVKIIQEDITGERFFDINTVENLIRIRMTTSGAEQVETVVIGI